MSHVSVHYALSCALLTLYGTQVCPFIDSLSVTALTLPILLTFICLFGCRKLLEKRIDSRELHTQVNAQFKVDITLFIAGGLALAAFNYVVYSFPLGSGLKIVLGMTAIGFFIACDLGLRRENRIAVTLQETGQQLEIDQSPYPITKKFGQFAAACALILCTVVSLVVAKDLAWLINLSEQEYLNKAALLIFAEITFVLVVMLAYILSIISAHGANLRLFFNTQRNTLHQVANGQLSARVPVASNNEFGVIARYTNETIATLQARTCELGQMRDATILALASLAETRDNETGAHILRTQQYVKVLAEHLKSHPRFSDVLTPSMIDLIYKSAPLHDAGKVGIPDAILLKPGKLTDQEFAIMKEHPMIGSKALQSAQLALGESSFLITACEIMETHHEKWDGSGYPSGLKGDEIPVSGRLMALADVYDALISERVYKPAFSHEKARSIIVDGRNSHFDPDIVDAFLQLETVFQQVAIDFSKPSSLVQSVA